MPQLNYSRFSHEERIILANRLSNGEKPIKIAAALGRPRCTIYREIARNSKSNKNKRTRVNKPSLAKLDARHFRGTIKAEEIKQAKIGGLEGDTIVSNNQKDRILTHVCRVT